MALTLSSFKNAISSCLWQSIRFSAWRDGFSSALSSLMVIDIWTDISLHQRHLSESRQHILSFGIKKKPLPLTIIIFWKTQDWPSLEKALNSTWAMGKLESKVFYFPADVPSLKNTCYSSILQGQVYSFQAYSEPSCYSSVSLVSLNKHLSQIKQWKKTLITTKMSFEVLFVSLKRGKSILVAMWEITD